jgi:hypothetical protein
MDVNDIEAPRSDQPDQLHRPPHIGSLPAQTLRRDACSFELANKVVLPRQNVRTLDVYALAVACCGSTQQPFGSTWTETFDDPEHLHRSHATQPTVVATTMPSSCLAGSRHSLVQPQHRNAFRPQRNITGTGHVPQASRQNRCSLTLHVLRRGRHGPPL